MSNNKQSSIELFIEQLEEKGNAYEENEGGRTINISIDISDYMELKIQAFEMHNHEIEMAKLEAIEIEIIKQCAERSTSNASKYAEGYKEGYKRALDYMSDTIKNKIEIKENGSNIFTTTGTTSTTFLCTQFVAQPRITTSLPNCIKCGKPQYQHPIITNTQ